jgi:hypothetical protein
MGRKRMKEKVVPETPRGFKQLDKALRILGELGICVTSIRVVGDADMAPNLISIDILAKLPLELR